VGVKPVIVGGAKKSAVLFVVPNGVVMLMIPEVTPTGAIAPIVVLFVTTNEVAGRPLKLTAEASVKLLPVILTIVPAGPTFGVKLLMLAGK